MKISLIVASLIILSIVLILVNPLYATKTNDSSIKQDMINQNIDISSLVYDLNSKPFNISYADWTEKWWQWTYSTP